MKKLSCSYKKKLLNEDSKMLKHTQEINVDQITSQVDILQRYILGYGIDIVNIQDFSKLLNLVKSQHLNCYFTLGEIAAAGNGVNYIKKLAGRFALKEAVMKALGIGWGNGVSFTDIEIFNKTTGEPYILLKRELAKLEKQKNITEWFVTTSHTSSVAIASAIAVNNFNYDENIIVMKET